jgi:hypothetical protein
LEALIEMISYDLTRYEVLRRRTEFIFQAYLNYFQQKMVILVLKPVPLPPEGLGSYSVSEVSEKFTLLLIISSLLKLIVSIHLHLLIHLSLEISGIVSLIQTGEVGIHVEAI